MQENNLLAVNASLSGKCPAHLQQNQRVRVLFKSNDHFFYQIQIVSFFIKYNLKVQRFMTIQTVCFNLI